MKEIKFRAFIKKPHSHHGFCSDEINWCEGKMLPIIEIHLEDELFEVRNHNNLPFGFSFEDADIMQYTGLQDFNGKEIYEGDVLRYKSPTESGKYIAKDILDFIIWYARLSHECSTKILGNKFENPELLND